MDEPNMQGVKCIALRWEALRVAYNVVLIAETLWLLRTGLAPALNERGEIALVISALFANAIFCIGPLLEIYSYLVLRLTFGPLRYVLFLVGLLIAMWVGRGWVEEFLPTVH